MQKEQISNWGIKVGSLTLAILLWLHAVTEHTYEKEIDISLIVEDPNSEPGVPSMTIGNLLPDRVRVLVAGPGKDLLQLNVSYFRLRVQAQARTNEINFYKQKLKVEDVENDPIELDIQVREILSPTEIEIALDRRIERTIKVNPLVQVQTAEAYTQVGVLRVEPPQIEISGPLSYIGTIQTINTDSLVLKDLEEDFEQEVALHVPKGRRIHIDPAVVTVSADIQILAEDEISGIPVEVLYTGDREMLTSPPRVRVKVRGPVDIVANIVAKTDLRLYVDYREYSGEPLFVRSEEDSFFEVRSISPARVDLIEK